MFVFSNSLKMSQNCIFFLFNYMLIFDKLQKFFVFSCNSFGGFDNRIITNPTFSWTMNPPVSWTYPDINAFQSQSFLPGQSLTQFQAQNAANGDITAAAIEALSSAGISSLGINPRPTYSPPLVNDCTKSIVPSTGTAIQTSVGEQFGIVEQGAVVYLASSTLPISAQACQQHSFGSTNPLTLTPFIHSASVTLHGITVSGYQLNQIAAQMMVYLNFNNRVNFVTEINYDK